MRNFGDFGYTPTHNLRTKRGRRNRDWRNSTTGEQYVFDIFGALVVNIADHGTKDKASPGNGLWNHYKEDAKPWVSWGNAANDPTTPGVEPYCTLYFTVHIGGKCFLKEQGIGKLRDGLNPLLINLNKIGGSYG